MKPTIWILTALFIMSGLSAAPAATADEPTGLGLFSKDNLVAWCIVPFDAKKRGPSARAEMLQRLGIVRVAYDWRQQHVPTFEEEIIQYKKHGIEYFAFWSWHDDMARLIEKHNIKPQIWTTLGAGKGDTRAEMVEDAARQLLPLVEKARLLGCRLGLYNHGGWGGEPKNMVAVAEWFRANARADHVGIVYNLHHGHGHIDDFGQVLALMKPYLLCLNLNGMNDNAQPKILPVGSGQHDRELLEIIVKSGYSGPIGILDHRGELDAEESLEQNLEGLAKLVNEM
jgi:sugar phosphate isomerase/epimerase